MKTSKLVIVILFILYANISYAENTQQQFNITRQQVEKQAEFVKNLTQASSLAKKLDASTDVNVKSIYRAAKELYQNALTYINDDNNYAAAESLFHAKRMMFQAAKLAGKQEVAQSNDNQIFELRLKSVNALLEAMQRIGDEKKVQEKTQQIKNRAEIEIASAREMMRLGEPEKAQKTLDTVYIYVKTAVSELRSGDTLVRSLHFKTKKEEYLYELDRNETHSMLVTLLLAEKMKDPQARARAQKFLDMAEDLKQKAQESAHNGNYEKAVEHFEASTRQIIRAIRSAGLYIPG